MNRPPVKIHDPGVRASLEDKIRRIVAAGEYRGVTPGWGEIPVGSPPWATTLEFPTVRTGEDGEAIVVHVEPTTTNALAALDAWYAQWPPELCEQPPSDAAVVVEDGA